jgi:hypothetical protein
MVVSAAARITIDNTLGGLPWTSAEPAAIVFASIRMA